MTDMNDKAYPERQSLEVVPEQRVAFADVGARRPFPCVMGHTEP